jgi:transposase InsO family protein
MIDHRKKFAYHPQDNGVVESFNNTLYKGLTKIWGLDRDVWDDKIPSILWAYRTSYKRSIVQMPFKLVYIQEAVIPLHLCANAGRIYFVLEFDHVLNTRQHFYQLNQLEEERMLV